MNEAFVKRILDIGLFPSVVPHFFDTAFTDTCDDSDSFKIFEGVSKKVCLFYTSRSGSTLLAEYMNQTQLFGDVQEHFNLHRMGKLSRRWGRMDMRDYLRRVVKESMGPNQVFAFKGTLNSLVPLARVAELPDHAADWHWVFIHRKDLVAQAVSLYRARKTGTWHSGKKGLAKVRTPDYAFDEILACYNSLLRMIGQIELFITRHRLNVLRLLYEDFTGSPEGAVEAICRHTGIQPPPGVFNVPEERTLQQLRNKITEEYALRFRQDLAERIGSSGGL